MANLLWRTMPRSNGGGLPSSVLGSGQWAVIARNAFFGIAVTTATVTGAVVATSLISAKTVLSGSSQGQGNAQGTIQARVISSGLSVGSGPSSGGLRAKTSFSGSAGGSGTGFGNTTPIGAVLQTGGTVSGHGTAIGTLRVKIKTVAATQGIAFVIGDTETLLRKATKPIQNKVMMFEARLSALESAVKALMKK